MTDTLVSTASTTEATGSTTEAPAPTTGARRPVWPGFVAFALGLLTAGALATGIVLATDDRFQTATYAAYAAAGLSVAAVLFGILALILRRARAWAVAGMVIGIVANPLLLTPALDAIGGLWA
jgi:uncharacterized membrane protein